MIKDTEIAIVGAVTKALQLINKDPYMTSEEIIQGVMASIEAKPQAKIYAIAAVSNAIKLKRHDKNLSDKQIAQESVSAYRQNLQNDTKRQEI